MSGYLILDTETTSLLDFRRPPEASGQPRMAAVAMIFLGAQQQWEFEWACLVQPEGWEMSHDAGAVNGLTTDRLRIEGLPVWVPLLLFAEGVRQGRTIVAHNAEFDLAIMRGELRRRGMDLEEVRSFCTMNASTSVCKLPGRKGYKWPKLSEAYEYFFDKPVENAHSALSDARACWQIFEKLNSLHAAA
jgi:DNA polymerase-3 subunit epsilon